MRIVYLNPCGTLGGAETSLRELLSSVRSAAQDCELWVVLGEDGPFADVARNLGVHVVVKPFPKVLARLGDACGVAAISSLFVAAGASIAYVHGLKRLLRQINPDLIHTNGFKMHVLGAWGRPRRVPMVWHIHDYVARRRVMSRLLRLVRKSCSVAIVNSKSVARDVESVLPGLPVVPIYNAVDLNRFNHSGPMLDLDAAAGFGPAAPGTIRVGLVATFARWKGHEIFLEALSRLPSDLLIRGYIIGAPIYQTVGSQWSLEELQQKVASLNLVGRVGFTGFIEDTAAAMRSLDIVVHASTQPEPFGMVIIEALACGRAVVVSRAGGAAELIEEGQTALAHSPGDVDSLKRRIADLASNEGLRQRLGRAGRSVAEEHYGGKRLAVQLLTVYKRAMDAQYLGEPKQSRSLSVEGE